MQNKDQHIFTRFDEEMRELHSLVVEMGNLAVKQLRDAVATLRDKDCEGAQQVIANDAKLNALDVAADDEVVKIIALRQPLARDLREIIAVSKIIAELERSGDEARKIAGLTICFYKDSNNNPPQKILDGLYKFAAFVDEMLVDAMRAFDDLNLPGAAAVLQTDAELDKQLQLILRNLSEIIVADKATIGYFVNMVLGIRALERFGGHAKNIAGHIIFIKNGTDVRHADVDEILQQINK